MDNNKKKALGKGLEQLFANNVIDFDNFEKDIKSLMRKQSTIPFPAQVS